MAVNLLLGVGGTGAKIVESVLHLCLAGLGPRQLMVGLVDQDDNNGNVTRTERLITDLIELREAFAPGAHALDWESDGPEATVLARTEISRLKIGSGPDSCHWRPASDSQGKLSLILDRARMDDDRKALMDLLFAPGPQEQDLLLDDGYRGYAHLGAACMLASLELTDGVFKREIGGLMSSATAGSELRIFLAGSIFGGTGAAGFPTLARWMNRMRKDEKAFPNGRRVKLGGALMWPYFSFQDPEEEVLDKNVVKVGDLMPQARSALEYYDGLFASEAVFDRVYMAGWNHFFHLQYHSRGDSDQRNPALPPELLGALGALDFFRCEMEEGPAATVDAYVCARGKDQALSWNDLPQLGGRDEVRDRLGALLRFAFYWLYNVDPHLRALTAGNSPDYHWIDDLVAAAELQSTTARAALADALRSTLAWAASMQMFSGSFQGDERFDFGLWDLSKVAEGDLKRPDRPVTVKESVSDDELQDIYDRMLAPARIDAATGADLLGEVTDPRRRKAAGKSRGLGRAAAMVHQAARLAHGDR